MSVHPSPHTDTRKCMHACMPNHSLSHLSRPETHTRRHNPLNHPNQPTQDPNPKNERTSSPRVPRDDAAAFALYSHGAALGDPWSTFTLGTWLCQGRGGEEEDWEKGFELHLRAAERFGMPQAAYNVGTHYFSGRGVEQDMAQAAVFFGRAARAGMTQGMVNLGNMYLEGLVPRGLEGLEGEGVEAAKVWYRRAAEAGDAEGLACLAKCETSEREERGQGKGKGGDV